jgi:glycosyltransferase involved in cell wall biosynthesis
VSAAHSGLAEVSATLADAVPPAAAPLLSFPLGPGAVDALADRIAGWLEAPGDLRARTREALVATARERYSWQGVARAVVSAAQGRLDELPPPV